MSQDKDVQFENLDDLFAAGLDDIADLPSFETPPKGVYIADLTLDVKEINGKSAVQAEFTIVETVELEDGGAPPVAGSKFSTAYMLGNDISTGKLKQLLAPLATHFDEDGKQGAVGRLVRDHVKQVRVAFTLKHRKDKEDADKFYPDVRNLSVA